ncbi:hypothetical protein D9M73_286360 [compost metagenome]
MPAQQARQQDTDARRNALQGELDAVEHLVDGPTDGAEQVTEVVHQVIEGGFHPLTQWNGRALERIEKTEL